jgi:hypothetical protein
MRSNSNIFFIYFAILYFALKKITHTFLFGYFKQILGMEVDRNYSGSVVFGVSFC